MRYWSVKPGATDDEIKAAYRRLAKKYHPDLNGGSAEAEAKMKEVNEAYSILIKHKGSYQSGSYGSTGGYGSGGRVWFLRRQLWFGQLWRLRPVRRRIWRLRRPAPVGQLWRRV